MSSAQALEALRTMHVVDIRVGAEIRRGVTAGNHQARQILAALFVKHVLTKPYTESQTMNRVCAKNVHAAYEGCILFSTAPTLFRLTTMAATNDEPGNSR